MKMLCRRTLCGAATLLVVGCDFAPEPSQIPTTMEITPNDTMLIVDDQAKLRVVVYDQDGEEMAGPPSWAPPKWFVDGRKDAISISPQGDVVAKKGASLALTAFAAGMEPAKARLRINPSSVKLSTHYYLNQVNQHSDGDVPVLANRQALLRVFVTGDETSYFRPNVRADFYRDGQIVHTVLMPASVDELGMEMVERNLVSSYNAVIPANVLQPGVEAVIEVDPEGVVPKKPGSQARIPQQGTLPLDLIALKDFRLTIVPTVRNSSPQLTVNSSWSSDLNPDTEHIRLLRNFLPIAGINLTAHETLYTDENLSTYNGWIRYRQQVWVLWQTEGQDGYYYGVVRSFSGSALGGVAYAIGWPPVSVGLDDPETFVHEVGHSMGLRHAPCGEPGGPDPNFPQNDGTIGGWGYNFASNSLVSPNSRYDVMTYCGPTWISDYYFGKSMLFRRRTEGVAEPPPPPEQTLLLWGRTGPEGVQLEPSFLIQSPPTRPATGGPYRLEGFGPAGEERFAFDFTPVPLGHGGENFLFTLPYDPDRDGTLERIVLSGPGGEDVLTPGSTPPMAILRDGPTGPIRAFLRDWDGAVPTSVAGRRLVPQVMLSDGIPGGLR